MYSIGNQIGVGKESGLMLELFFCLVELRIYSFLDIYMVADGEGKEMVLKLHRYRLAKQILCCDELNRRNLDSDECPFEQSKKSGITLGNVSLHLGCICPG